MKKSLPGILLLIAMPCSVLLFVKVQESTGSDLIALLTALLLYAAVFVVCALVFNKPDPRNIPMEHPVIREDETQSKDAAGCANAETNDTKKEN